MNNPFIKPRKEFVERTRALFIMAFRQKFPFEMRLTRFPLFAKGFALGVALMFVMGGTAAYADQKNVSAENPLYPLKRSYETLRVILSLAEDEPIVQAHLATRRLEEIRIIKEKNPGSPKIVKLREDLDDALQQSVRLANGEEKKEDREKNDGKSLRNLKTIDMSEVGESEVEIEIEKEMPIPEGREKSEPKSFYRSQKDKSLCAFWDELIEGEDDETQGLVDRNNLFLQKFERKCISE